MTFLLCMLFVTDEQEEENEEESKALQHFFFEGGLSPSSVSVFLFQDTHQRQINTHNFSLKNNDNSLILEMIFL